MLATNCRPNRQGDSIKARPVETSVTMFIAAPPSGPPLTPNSTEHIERGTIGEDLCRKVLKRQVLERGGTVQKLVISKTRRWGIVWRANYYGRSPVNMPGMPDPSDYWRLVCWSKPNSLGLRPSANMVRIGPTTPPL